MIKQLIKQIWIQRTVNIWLWLELIVVFVCLSYVVDFLYVTASTYFSPLGYSYEHVYKVELSDVQPASSQYVKNETDSMLKENVHSALARIRAYPGVESACVNRMAPPYNKSSSNGSRGIDSVWVHGHIFRVSPSFFQVFEVKDKQGNIAPLVEAAMQSGTIIMSEDAERKFEQEGITALYNELKNWKENTEVVRGITVPFRFDEFSTVYPAYFECNSETEIISANGVHTEFAFRLSPQYDTPEFVSTLRNDMKNQLRIGNLYLVDIVSFKDLRANYYKYNGKINNVKTHLSGLLFLLINIFLGVIGTFWIRTQQRRAEIALRMALGASTSTVRRYLLSEGGLLLLFAAVPASVICMNVIYMDLIKTIGDNFTVGRFIVGQLLTYCVMAIMIAIGVFFPSKKAMSTRPSEALHEE